MPEPQKSIFAGLPDNLPKPPEGAPKVELPAELQGKTPEEIYTSMSTAHHQEVDAAVNRTKAEIADKAVTAKPDEPKPGEKPRYGPYTPGQQQAGQQQPGQPAGEAGPDQYLDPEGFMAAQFDKRIQPLATATVSAMRESNKQGFKNSLPEGEYETYGEEIEQMVNGFAPQVQMHPNAYRVAYNYARSLHVDEISTAKGDEIANQKLTKVLAGLGISPEAVKTAMESGEPVKPPGVGKPVSSLFQPNVGVPVVETSTPSTTVSSTPVKKAPKKTEEQKRIIGEFGMTDKEYDEYAELNTDLISQLTGGER
jgi:hypothetical protein